jgi:hypothetical protein
LIAGVQRSALALALVLATAPLESAAADERLVDFPEWIDLTELVLPDSRWQWEGLFQRSRFVLSWPAPIAFAPVHLHGGTTAGFDLLPLLVPEPQVAFGGGRVDWRIQGALRGVLVHGRHPVSGLAELLAVHGSDNPGAGFGLGVGLDGAISLVYRMTFVGGQVRQDLSIDFHVFSLPMSRYLNGLEGARKERPPPPPGPPTPARMREKERPACDPPGCGEVEEEPPPPAPPRDPPPGPVDVCGNGLIGVREYRPICPPCIQGRPCPCGWAPEMEECDGTTMRGETCGSLGLPAGALRCTSDCRLDRVGCGQPGQ